MAEMRIQSDCRADHDFSAWQRVTRPVTITAVVASVLAAVIGARLYRVAVEDSTMEVMQCAQIIRPEPDSCGSACGIKPGSNSRRARKAR